MRKTHSSPAPEPRDVPPSGATPTSVLPSSAVRSTFVFADEETAPDGSPAPELAFEGGASRFEVRRSMGVGGMGEVLGVWDPVLQREVALKVGHANLMHNPALRQRFIEEARIQARLQHPNLVPVHDMGVMPDGRPWFTMDIIRGESFHDVIARVHAASTQEWSSSSDGWSLHRMVSVLAQACRAVGFAHGLGVVHRDLKPRNLMVGAFGEVRVVDWGIASMQAPDGSTRTNGGVSGTPNYMSPEQASGGNEPVDARTDVYALGAVLYEILAGQAPYDAEGSASPNAPTAATAVLDLVQAGPPRSVRKASRLPPPRELADVVERAMQRSPQQRFHDANALAAAIDAWLEGSRHRAIARGIVIEADRTRDVARQHRREATALRESAARALTQVPAWAPAEQKAEAWAMEDQAAELEREAELIDARRVQAYRAALSHASDSPEAHAALAAHHREELLAAEHALNAAGAAIAALHLRRHLQALPATHPVRLDGLPWLEGDGSLTLATTAPGARLDLERLVLRNRRLVAEPVRPIGPAPLVGVTLPMGSWRLAITAPGCAPTVYPFSIERGGAWTNTHPATNRPAPLRLLPARALDDDDVYVPAGWFHAGGDPRAPGNPLSGRKVWVEGFVVKRYPVTHRQYLQFLNGLVHAGREADALAFAPRLMGATPMEAGPLLYAYELGRFSMQAEPDGPFWSLDVPVVLVNWHGATAYAAWLASTTGKPWRLVDELEREKAARGVDGRIFPWGDVFDPSWTTMRDSHAGKPRPSEVTGCPTDESVYGVRGVAGNVLDWTCTLYQPDGQTADGHAHTVVADSGPGRRVTRGGSWNDAASSTRCATRYNLDPTIRLNFLSFRVAYPVA